MPDPEAVRRETAESLECSRLPVLVACIVLTLIAVAVALSEVNQ